MFAFGLASPRTIIPAAVIALTCAAYAQDRPALDVPYVPTPESVVKRMLQLGKVDKDDFVMDLGSGDGRIAIAAAKDFGARAVGIDIDPRRIQEAKENAAKAGVTGRVEFRQENLFETPIKDADVITMYLLTSVNLKLRPRLLDELQPGTRLVSHAFNMGEWKPDAYERVENRDVYLWIVPAKVAGQWAVKDGARTFTMNVEQTFQELKGSATVDGKPSPLVNAKMIGDEIVFTVDIGGKPATFQGKVTGDKMEAIQGPVATQSGWSATRASKG